LAKKSKELFFPEFSLLVVNFEPQFNFKVLFTITLMRLPKKRF